METLRLCPPQAQTNNGSGVRRFFLCGSLFWKKRSSRRCGRSGGPAYWQVGTGSAKFSSSGDGVHQCNKMRVRVRSFVR